MQPSYTRKVPIAEQPQLVREAADLGMQSMKFLFIFALLTLFLDLDVAAATSTRTSIRPRGSTGSDHQYGMHIPRPEVVGLLDDEVDDSLNERPNIGLDEEIEENGQLKRLQASQVQRAELHRRYNEIAQKKNKNIAVKQPLDSQSREFSGGEHVEDDYGKNTELDQPVAKASSSKHVRELVNPSNLEAVNVILQPAVELLQSNEGLDTVEDDDLYDKAKVDAGEVVMTEERDEDKKLIPDYNLGEPIKDWNRKRQEWAREHPEVKQEQLFILTGTQPWPCTNPEGDHLLLRCFKNKVDYSRIHGIGLFYNTALLDAHMPTFWAKLPVVRATMLAHPEVEWIWWLDADAIITDMEFSIPLHRYSAYNLVVHGWESLIFEKRSWLGLNAGSFLLRNCQWSLELLERWASMGPKAPMGDAYRHILSDFLPDRPRNPTDDQAALVFLLIKERQRWAGKLRVELDFFLSGYWLELMDGFEAIEERYRAMEEQHAELWELLERQGAVGKEKLVAAVGRARELHLSGTSVQQRRSFITHFTGCQPCSGHHNNIYSSEQCRHGLLRALNYADDQVLRTLGYHHSALHLPDVLSSNFRATA